MSTNPNNAVGTNGAFGGRTSVNAFNDVLSVFKSRGIVSGWGIVPDSGMDVAVGGDGSTRDVAIAEDNIGNKTTVNNISQQPVTVSIPAAPASNSRIDLIVAYVDNPAQGVATETDNYGACGLIVVSGATAANPVAPDESDIRTAITTDGGAGSVAYYVVLGSVTVASGTTDISSNMISAGAFAAVKSDNVDYANYHVSEEQRVGVWANGKWYYRRVITFNEQYVPTNAQVTLLDVTSWGIGDLVSLRGMLGYVLGQGAKTTSFRPMPFVGGGADDIRLDIDSNLIRIRTYSNWAGFNRNWVVVEYTKMDEKSIPGYQ